MPAYSAKLNLTKLKKDVSRAIRRIGDKTIESGLSQSDKRAIGEELIDAIKDQVSKGISPILGRGRFDGYKAVTAANSILRGGKGGTKASRARRRAKAKSVKRQGYPYSVRGKFPGKRERPVNLYLSGRFLNDLKARVLKRGLEFGFYTKLSTDKELGHREGANTQPERPIIPIRNEQLNRTVYNRLVTAVARRIKQAVAKAIKT